MNKQTAQKKSAYHMVLAAGVLWGLSPLVYKQSLAVMTITVFLAGRFLFGALAAFAFERKKFKKVPKNLILPIISLSIINGLVLNYVYSFAVQRTSVLHIAILGLATPFVVYFFASFLLKEKVHRQVVGGAVLSATGLLLIILGGYNSVGNSGIIGDIIMLTYVICNALVIVGLRRILSKNKNRISAEQIGFIEYSIAATVLIIFIIINALNGQYTITIDAKSLLLVIFAGTIIGVLPLMLYLRATKLLPAERLVDVNFISPFVGILSGVLVLGEGVTTSLIVGGSILFAGLLIGNNKIHPILLAHQLYLDEKYVIRILRHPQKAYVYVTRFINK